MKESNFMGVPSVLVCDCLGNKVIPTEYMYKQSWPFNWIWKCPPEYEAVGLNRTVPCCISARRVLWIRGRGSLLPGLERNFLHCMD